jgi:hypothetical protein
VLQKNVKPNSSPDCGAAPEEYRPKLLLPAHIAVFAEK